MRRMLAVVCLVLACITPAAALSAWWVYGQATDTARFSETARPLATDATVQAAVVDELLARTRAPARLRPSAEALVRTKAYQRSWLAIQRSAHARLAVRLTGDVRTPLELDLAPVAAILRARVAAAGLAPVANAIADPAPVVLLDRAEVRRAHDATNIVRIVRGIAIPLAVLALLGVVLTAPRIGGGLVRAGLCLGVSTLLVVAADALARDAIFGPLRRAVYDVLTEPLGDWLIGGAAVAVAFVLAGAVVIAVSRPRRAPARPAGPARGA
ncbi:MAG TPA: hypothetical protein VGO10_10755 [Baekduia sp.]|nr:hypothetical protein [Baekduia sp.]